MPEKIALNMGQFGGSGSPDDDLLTPSQVKHIVDEMLVKSRFNDEYTASVYDTEEIRRLNPVDRKILQLIYNAKRLRAQLVANDISEVVDGVHEISAELNIPIRRGSVSEKILGREMLRTIANYYEESTDRERKERGLADDPELKNLSLDQLKERVSKAWQRQYGTVEATMKPPVTSITLDTGKSTKASSLPDGDGSTKEDFSQSTFSSRLARHEVLSKIDRSLYPDMPTSAVWDEYIFD